MESDEEKIQNIALEAIKEVTETQNPVKYAELNYNVYEVALMAAKLTQKAFEI